MVWITIDLLVCKPANFHSNANIALFIDFFSFFLSVSGAEFRSKYMYTVAFVASDDDTVHCVK